MSQLPTLSKNKMSLQGLIKTVSRLRGAVFAVSDQGIYSVGQLLLSVMLARSLSPEDFGSASAILAVVGFQYILHCAFIHEPLLISQRFSGRLTALSCCGIVISGTLLILCATAAHNRDGQWSWAAVALIATSEIFWLSRTVETVARRFKTLCCYGVLVCLAYWLLLKLCAPDDWGTGLFLISLAQCPFLILLSRRFRSVVRAPHQADDEGLTAKQSAIYGVQATISQLSSWVMTGGTIIFLGSSANPEQGGLLKIYITMLLPMQYVLAALGYYMLPRLASDWRLGKRAETFRAVALFASLGALAAEAFGVIIYYVGPLLVGIVFGDAYASMNFSPFLYAPSVFAATMCLRTGFRAMAQPTGLLVCSLMGAGAFALSLGLGATNVSYLQTVTCMTIGFCVTAATMVGWLLHSARGSRPRLPGHQSNMIVPGKSD